MPTNLDSRETAVFSLIPSRSKRKTWRSLPKGIWVLGFGSLFMDMSSELVHSLLPILMATVLGASLFTIGIIEGIAEATASMMKVLSGTVSDYFRKRKFLVIVGYSLSALTKPIFPLAGTIWWVLGARFVDRIGKGIRGAPRDALVADITPLEFRGSAYGLRQALDTVGAFIGPLLALVFMLWFASNIKSVLWVAVAPAITAVILLAAGVREPESGARSEAQRNCLRLTDARRLSVRYWLVVSLGAVFALARFSEAFLILRARDIGLAAAYVPGIMIVMNIFYSLFAYPAGAAADRFSARILLVFGLGMLVLADVILAAAHQTWTAFLGSAFWGLHMAFSQGLLSKLVADTAPVELRGTAFGIFNLVGGTSLLLASIIAGFLWDLMGAPATFIAGASFAAAAGAGLLLYPGRSEPARVD